MSAEGLSELEILDGKIDAILDEIASMVVCSLQSLLTMAWCDLWELCQQNNGTQAAPSQTESIPFSPILSGLKLAMTRLKEGEMDKAEQEYWVKRIRGNEGVETLKEMRRELKAMQRARKDMVA